MLNIICSSHTKVVINQTAWSGHTYIEYLNDVLSWKSATWIYQI